MKKAKKWLWLIVVVFLIISISLNIKNQLIVLLEARKKNNELEDSIEIMKMKNQKLIKQIEYASSSAFIDQERHDKLALGGNNDVWLILKDEQKIDLRPKVNENIKIANYKQWLNLFTR